MWREESRARSRDGDLLRQSLPLSPGPGASSPPPPAADPPDLLPVTGCSPRPLGASRARLTRREDSSRSGARVHTMITAHSGMLMQLSINTEPADRRTATGTGTSTHLQSASEFFCFLLTSSRGELRNPA
ncbi:hypothetical protein EYF80_062054 [Liparis tanakae]|uniref:Uncharacterized protein n=1 Tax=Liparis tanakae TaxID=230148 RepID=A0A4Z2EFX6_9TELE|nr:hypothetical protein EYF80_062054 [Liparis tanakae]